MRLNQQLSNIVIHWAGGLHHAKKFEASGLCRDGQFKRSVSRLGLLGEQTEQTWCRAIRSCGFAAPWKVLEQPSRRFREQFPLGL